MKNNNENNISNTIKNVAKNKAKKTAKKALKKYIMAHAKPLLLIIAPLLIIIVVVVFLLSDVGDMGDNIISDKLTAQENKGVIESLQIYLDNYINITKDVDEYGIVKQFYVTQGNVFGYMKYIETREGKDADELFGNGSFLGEKEEEKNNKNDKTSNQSYLITGKKYTINSGFGSREDPVTHQKSKFHSGIDIGVPMNTPIYALKDGTVTFAGMNDGGYGNLVIIDHGDMQTYYAHNSKVDVSKGQKVKTGQLISHSGSTGKSTGPHLHFEVKNKNGESVDPSKYYDGFKSSEDLNKSDLLTNYTQACYKIADRLKPTFTFLEGEQTDTVTLPSGKTKTTTKKVKIVSHISCIYGEIDLLYGMDTSSYSDKDGNHSVTKPVYKGYKLNGQIFDNLKEIIKRDYPYEQDFDMAICFVVNSSLNFDKKQQNGDWINKDPKSLSIDDFINNAIPGGGAGGDFSGDIPLFYQWDERWGNHHYSSENIAKCGCGVTCLAMVTTGLEGNLGSADKNGDGIFTPDEAADYSTANGGVEPGAGTIGSKLYPMAASSFGLSCRQYTSSQYQKVIEELKNGCPVITNVQGSKGTSYGLPGSTFTQNQHFIVLTGIDENNRVTVHDPNGRAGQNEKKWDFSSIIVPELCSAETYSFYAFDNPNLKYDQFWVTAYTNGGGINGGTGSKLLGDGSLAGKDIHARYIAVDPSLVPLGSIVYMRFPNDRRYLKLPDGSMFDKNGAYTAVDTGGAIKQKRIDLFVGSDSFFQSLGWDNSYAGVRIKKR